MSFRAMAWAWEQRQLPPFQRLTLMALVDHINEDGECWPSRKRLAADTGVCVKTVERSLEQLEEAGLITRRPHFRDDRSQTSNRYRINADMSTPIVSQSPPPCNGRRAPLPTGGEAPYAPESHHEPGTENPVIEPDSVNPDSARAPEKAKAAKSAKITKGPELGPLVDAFRAIHLPDPKFVGSEAPAAQELLRHFEPSEIAECWGDFAAARHGDNWERQRLSFGLLRSSNRVGNWQVWRDAGKPEVEVKNGNRGVGNPGAGGRSVGRAGSREVGTEYADWLAGAGSAPLPVAAAHG